MRKATGITEMAHEKQRFISYILYLFTAMEFHENLNSIGAKEGLKERKMLKAVESFTWNITILKVDICL